METSEVKNGSEEKSDKDRSPGRLRRVFRRAGQKLKELKQKIDELPSPGPIIPHSW